MRSSHPVPSCVSIKSDRSMDQPPRLNEGRSPAAESPIQQERLPSPVLSCVSMMSDSSIDQPPKLGERHSPIDERRPIQQMRSSHPVPSCVSIKSDRSMDQPPRLNEGRSPAAESPIQQERLPSPVLSCVSMMSDSSIDQPPKLGERHSPIDESGPDQRPVSPVPSCVSMKSNKTMIHPLAFKDCGSTKESPIQQKRSSSPVLSCVSMKSVVSMDQPPRLGDGQSPAHQNPIQQKTSSSPVPSCMVMKSDRSIDPPLNFGEGQSSAHQSFQTDVDSCMSDHDLTMSSPGTPQAHHESEEEDFTENRSDSLSSEEKVSLKSHLKEKLQHILEGSSNPVLLSDIYTELYITEGDGEGVNNEHEVKEIEAATRENTEGTLIKCSDIFEPLQEQRKPIRTVLTKGIAGIGKTVCVQKFVLDWAEGIANQDVKYIFPLSFRELNLLKAKPFSLLKLLRHFVGEFKSVEVLENGHHEVLFIFDGLDECRLPLAFEENETLCQPTKEASLDVLLTNLIQGHLLPSALIWITSRPAAAGRIPQGCVDRVTAVHGFGNDQKKEYFRKRIKDQTLAEKVVEHIKSLRSLHIMCHIPVFCWISASVLERLLEEAEAGAVPKNLTEMYTHFLIIQTRVKENKYTHFPDTGNKMIFKLGKLAFQQLEKGNLIFYEDDLRECGIDVTEASVYSGVCTQIFREESGLYQGKVFCFVHLSIQEFLAALYVLLHYFSKDPERHPSSCLASLFTAPTLSDLQITAVDKALQQSDGKFDLFLRFLLGLCSRAHQPGQTVLQYFITDMLSTSVSNTDVADYIKTRIKINLAPEQSINLFHCLNELNDHSLVEEIQEYQKSRRLSKVSLSPEQWSALVFVLLTSERSLDVFDLGKYCGRPSDKSLFRMRPVLKESRRAELASCSLTSNSCETLATVIGSQNSHLRELDLSDNNIQDAGVTLLSQGIQKPSCKLERLCLSKCGIGPSGCTSLMSALLRNVSHLTDLDLSHNHPGHDGMDLLCTVLQTRGCRINKLKLIYCNLKDRSCKPLARALSSKNTCLSELDLSQNSIQNSGVIDLCVGLRNCKLTSLRLSNCGVREQGCQALASALAYNPSHLRELFISYNDPGLLGSRELEALKQKRWSKLEVLKL